MIPVTHASLFDLGFFVLVVSLAVDPGRIVTKQSSRSFSYTFDIISGRLSLGGSV